MMVTWDELTLKVTCPCRVPRGTLKRLGTSPDERGRWNLSTNKAAPEESLKLLSTDWSTGVVEGVACNPATPKETLKFLISHKNKWVRVRAEENLAANHRQ